MKQTDMVKYEEGEWCIHEFNVSQIKKVDKETGWVDVSDGLFSYGTTKPSDCVPLTLRNLSIAKCFESVRSRIHEEYSIIDLNFPDIHRWLVQHWIDTTEALNDEDITDLKTNEHWNKLRQFEQDIKDGVRNSKDKRIGDTGISLFRR